MFPSAKYVSSSKGVTIEKPTVTPTPRQSPKPKNSRPPSLPMQERITAQDSNPIKISFNNPRGDRRALRFILIHFLLYSKYGSETETVKHFKIGFDFHQHIVFIFHRNTNHSIPKVFGNRAVMDLSWWSELYWRQSVSHQVWQDSFPQVTSTTNVIHQRGLQITLVLQLQIVILIRWESHKWLTYCSQS